MSDPVYATVGLLAGCRRLAADADPRPVSVSLAATPAAELPGAESLPADAPVLTDFYLPDAGGSIARVFGMDLAVPSGVDGRFVSHPDGTFDPSVSDDLHATLLVGVPPWEDGDVRAYGWRGRRELVEVDAEPPAETVE